MGSRTIVNLQAYKNLHVYFHFSYRFYVELGHLVDQNKDRGNQPIDKSLLNVPEERDTKGENHHQEVQGSYKHGMPHFSKIKKTHNRSHDDGSKHWFKWKKKRERTC